MWWCLFIYCGEEGVCVLCSASIFLLLGKMCLVSFSSYQSCCVYPQSEGKTSHYCLEIFMVWCVTVIVVCSELRILLLCGSDLLESFCIPGLWNESDVRYDSFFLSFLNTNMYKNIYYSCTYFVCSPKNKAISRARVSGVSSSHSFVYIQTNQWHGCDCNKAFI